VNKLWLIPLLLIATPLQAQSITPSFTQGSMQATTTTTQTVTETIDQEIFGGTYNSWSGTNVISSGAPEDITNPVMTWSIHTAGQDFTLETVSRPAGVVEQLDINRTITTNSTTTSLSIFSQ